VLSVKKNVVAAVALIVVLAGSAIALYLTEANINYWYEIKGYQYVGSQWFTLYGTQNTSGCVATVQCINRGLLRGSFNLIIKLTNASFPAESFEPQQLVDSRTAKLLYSLGFGERANASIPFNVDRNVTGFVIKISAQENQPLTRCTLSTWGEQNEYYYRVSSNDTFYPPVIC
jgi:hypothetical protein